MTVQMWVDTNRTNTGIECVDEQDGTMTAALDYVLCMWHEADGESSCEQVYILRNGREVVTVLRDLTDTEVARVMWQTGEVFVYRVRYLLDGEGRYDSTEVVEQPGTADERRRVLRMDWGVGAVEV